MLFFKKKEAPLIIRLGPDMAKRCLTQKTVVVKRNKKINKKVPYRVQLYCEHGDRYKTICGSAFGYKNPVWVSMSNSFIGYTDDETYEARMINGTIFGEGTIISETKVKNGYSYILEDIKIY